MPLRRNQPEAGNVYAIFVHAGAGYHSFANEKHHLNVVKDAAIAGMGILKSGGSAVDAVEMAVRLLEDREMTNAGYGSNLTFNGTVECDAIVVDHLGRSGAAGCISQVRNPIAAARIILDTSSQKLSLSRVPPNLLVGAGATEFAAEHGLPILPHDYLISRGAYGRWMAWKRDLKGVAERVEREERDKVTAQHARQAPTHDEQKVARHDSVLSRSSTAFKSSTLLVTSDPNALDMMTSQEALDLRREGPAPDLLAISKHAIDPSSYQEYAKMSEALPDRTMRLNANNNNRHLNSSSPAKRKRFDGYEEKPTDVSDDDTITDPDLTESDLEILNGESREREGRVTDTVGVIAVDRYGNIAAASSSGGIGMKHQGRCGPAALLGIGAAVIPVDKDDPDQTSVATVTSGTGEHMATTMAAATAASRIYLRVRKHGPRLKSCDESEALRAMIEVDFMKHPGVAGGPCDGAIGILAVKKTKHGIYFYFAHNTASFVVASMSSEDQKPSCVMSRNPVGPQATTEGGKAFSNRRFRPEA